MVSNSFNLIKALLVLVLMSTVLWAGTAFVMGCSSTAEEENWSLGDDDGDGYLNGVDLYPFNPNIH